MASLAALNVAVSHLIHHVGYSICSRVGVWLGNAPTKVPGFRHSVGNCLCRRHGGQAFLPLQEEPAL